MKRLGTRPNTKVRAHASSCRLLQPSAHHQQNHVDPIHEKAPSVTHPTFYAWAARAYARGPPHPLASRQCPPQ
eukprot:10703089-Prorocentrum_lima.AAC.1